MCKIDVSVSSVFIGILATGGLAENKNIQAR